MTEGFRNSVRPTAVSGIAACEEIRRERLAARLTHTEASELVHGSLRAWQDWEYGQRKMPGGQWELFCIKTSTSAHGQTSGADRMDLSSIRVGETS